MVESRECFDERKLNIAFPSRGVRALVGRFARDGRASLAISAALMMGAILGLAGLSIDVTLLSTLRSRVQAAVDAATVTGSRNLLDYVAVNGFGSVGRYYPTIQTQTVNAIQANLQLEKNLSNIVIGLPSVIYNQNSGTVSAGVDATYNPIFMKLFGFKAMPIRASSTSTSKSLIKYFQIVFLVDVSQSMAVGGTVADIKKTKDSFGCTFACHQLGDDTLTKGRMRGIVFKMDYAKTAIANFLSQMQSISGSNASAFYSAAIYTFSDKLRTLIEPTSMLSNVAQAAAWLDVELLATAPYKSVIGHTNITAALSSLAQTLPKLGGDGSSSTSPQTILVLITDGAQDLIGSELWAGYSDGNWADSCAAFKAKNAIIYAINTYYYPYTDDGGYYNKFVSPFASQIQAAFPKCVSAPSNAILASDGPGITSAVNRLFQKITSSIRVSN